MLLAPLVTLAACPDGAGDTDAPMSAETSTSATTGAAPTTSASDAGSTTAEPDDSTAVSTSTSEAGASTGSEPAPSCVEHRGVNDCEVDPRCRWASIFQFTHGVQGCQGDVIESCVDDAAGVASTWYRGEGGGHQVLQFDNTPDDLPPEWRRCDCDGPLACLCGSGVPDCPGRVDEFCAAIIAKPACTNAAIAGELRCGWFRVSPEGPPDDQCTTQVARDVCLAATSPTADTCTKFTPPYPQCSSASAPVYYREVDGVIQLTASCGPVPAGWTACTATDTPEQPDECGCLCL